MRQLSLKKGLLLGLLSVVVLLAGWKGIEATSTDQFCVTCHIMEPMAEASVHTAHRLPEVQCKDCHLPHDNPVKMLGFKAYSGIKDVAINAVGPPDVIRATPISQDIIQVNCIRCHEGLVKNMNTEGRYCFDCHRSIPHGNSGL